MNDPWDVKSVRQSNQYVSCMKISGVPLLPPVLSRECRKEMQYYKYLAKEVEKRISLLKPYVNDSTSECSDDKTDAPDLPDSEHDYELPQEEIQAGFNINIDKIKAVSSHVSSSPPNNIKTPKSETPTSINSPQKLVIDLSLSINETGRNIIGAIKNNGISSSPIDLPERDYDCLKKSVKNETDNLNVKHSKLDDTNINFRLDNDALSDPLPEFLINKDGPSSLTSKSFTGSLIDIHTESMKEFKPSNLIRQRSYTLLKPSPQLLAHLEVQSISTGVDMACISMSESQSSLYSPNKKRRSWDLETAKSKWSSMALELSQKNVPNTQKPNGVTKSNSSKITPKKSQSAPPARRSVIQEKTRTPSVTKVCTKSEPLYKTNRKSSSPVRNISTIRSCNKEMNSPKAPNIKKDATTPNPHLQTVPGSEDPAARVRELYEKIQKQQLIQMSSLVEKQKREQLLLHQVFEEQNNMLYKQLKTICPKPPADVKEGWRDNQEEDRGPVSLSQLINHKPQEYDSPVADALSDTNSYIKNCEDILKRSKDISSSIVKQPQNRVLNPNVRKLSSPKLEISRTKTDSPIRNTSRKLNYDTSVSSDREYDAILTDRTNDTMADLNVTFPTDPSEDENFPNVNETYINDMTLVPRRTSVSTVSRLICSSPDNTTVENVQRSSFRNHPIFSRPPTMEEREAASRIVGGARGFLVRRLLRTERVQRIVRTIRDALLCALQLHRDTRGIRGADVALHRRLIQQITAACYSLHETFVTSSPEERCAMIAADRQRRLAKAVGHLDVMSQSHSGAFPTRPKRAPPADSLLTQSTYETFSQSAHGRFVNSPHRRPWR